MYVYTVIFLKIISKQLLKKKFKFKLICVHFTLHEYVQCFHNQPKLSAFRIMHSKDLVVLLIKVLKIQRKNGAKKEKLKKIRQISSEPSFIFSKKICVFFYITWIAAVLKKFYKLVFSFKKLKLFFFFVLSGNWPLKINNNQEENKNRRE